MIISNWSYDAIEGNTLVQIGLTVAIIILLITAQWLTRKSLTRLGREFDYTPTRTAATKRLMSWGLYLLSGLFLIIIWGGNLENLWVSIGSILGVIAIGFFAIWSILSNIVAGIIIYAVNPFEITDTLVLVEKNVTGKVIDIGLIYTRLEDEEGTFTVPNNLFFQQVVKVKKVNSQESSPK